MQSSLIINLDIGNRTLTDKFPNNQKLKNTFLDNPPFIGKVPREIKIIFKKKKRQQKKNGGGQVKQY